MDLSPPPAARRRSSLLLLGGGATRVRTPVKESNKENSQQLAPPPPPMPLAAVGGEDESGGAVFAQASRRFSSTSASSRRSSVGSLGMRLSGTEDEVLAGQSNNNRPWSIKDFETGKPLGKGKFGNVYSAKQKSTGVQVALKVLFKQPMVAASAVHTLRREVELQSRLQHRNIARLFGYFHDAKNVYLVLEFLGGGELYKAVARAGGCVSEAQARIALRDVASAVAYMHERHVAHRDIKPENILVSDGGRLCLCDFGWAVHVPPPLHTRRFTMCGTPEYLAPEMLINGGAGGHGREVDLWALGVLLFELLVGNTPFLEKRAPSSDDPEAVEAAAQEAQQRTFGRIVAHAGGPLHFPAPCNGGPAVSAAGRAAVQAMLQPSAADRPSAEAFLACAWCSASPGP